MRIGAIVQIGDEAKMMVFTMPYIKNDDKVFECIDTKIKKDIDPEGLVLDIYRGVPTHDIKNPVYRGDPEVIIDLCCKTLGVTYDQVVEHAENRKVKHRFARYIIAYNLYTRCDVSLKKVGRIIGGKDHATVLNALKKYDKFYKDDWHDFMDIADSVTEAIVNSELYA